MPNDNETAKPGMKLVAIAASAILVAALAATGVLAYGQNNTGSNLTTLEDQGNATGAASANTTETASLNATDDAGEQQDDETTFTASTTPNSECSSVVTTEGAVSLNGTLTMTAEEVGEEAETMTAGLSDTQNASLDQLIENACDAIRDGKSITALGHLQTARDILSAASEIEAAEDESGDVDATDEDNES